MTRACTVLHCSCVSSGVAGDTSLTPQLTDMAYVEISFADLKFYERLGGGATGTVYRGLWVSKDKIVALKKLNILEKEVS